jgi:hypothetical protein
MKKVLFLIFYKSLYYGIALLGLFFLLLSCSIEEETSVCLDGHCDGVFRIDTQANPGSYQDSNGDWHVKYSGNPYFTIKGDLDQMHSQYSINGTPLIETAYDSNYFYTIGNVSWTYPIYSYLGMFTNNNFTSPIPVGYQTYTFTSLISQQDIMNLAGYTIQHNPHPNINHPAYRTYFSTYSKYNYTPQKSMVFFSSMIGQQADVYIRVSFNSDVAGDSEERIYKLHLIFED